MQRRMDKKENKSFLMHIIEENEVSCHIHQTYKKEKKVALLDEKNRHGHMIEQKHRPTEKGPVQLRMRIDD